VAAEEDRSVKVALLGAGLVGQQRLLAIQQLRRRGRDIRTCGIFDPGLSERAEVERKFETRVFDRLDQLLDACPDWIVIATPHDTAVDLAVRALSSGFSVLVEKPLGRSLAETKRVASAAISPAHLGVGFNYRFYPGIAAAIDDARRGVFGPLISVNIEMGHGCNPDIASTWKLDPVRAGGGCLIDPGIHLLDLCRLICPGSLSIRGAWSWQGFWKTGIEEECHLLLDAGTFLIDLKVSIVRWRSVFRMEFHGQDGYGVVTGRNRSYGDQSYTRGRRWAWKQGLSQADSEQLVIQSPGDDTFADEMDALFFGNRENTLPPGSASDAIGAMDLLERCRETISSPALEQLALR
jgi:predicted dehydrogenase